MVLVAGQSVRKFEYRTALVADPVFTVDFQGGDSIHDLWRELARACNSTPGNHEVYQVGDVVVMFSDWKMTVGTRLDQRRW